MHAILKLWKWNLVMVVLPWFYVYLAASGTFSVYNDLGMTGYWSTPAWAGFSAMAAGLLGCYGIAQPFITYFSMAEIRAKVNKQTLVVDAYKDQLEQLEEQVKPRLEAAAGSDPMLGNGIPTGALVQQIGDLRERMADAEATRAKAEIDLEEWLLGPLRGQATYFYNIVEARKLADR